MTQIQSCFGAQRWSIIRFGPAIMPYDSWPLNARATEVHLLGSHCLLAGYASFSGLHLNSHVSEQDN